MLSSKVGEVLVGVTEDSYRTLLHFEDGSVFSIEPYADGLLTRPWCGKTIDLLQVWITRDPSFRTVTRMARINGKCLVELRSKSGAHESVTQETFDSAIRTVLMIAMGEGEK